MVTCNSDLKKRYNYKSILTNPIEHNKDNFTYIVHGIMQNDPKTLQMKLSRILSSDSHYRASLIGRRPELSRTHIFGKLGIIINPTKNGQIRIAWPFDIGSPNKGDDELRKFVRKYDLWLRRRSPEELLTGPLYNELIIRGNNDTNQMLGIAITDSINRNNKRIDFLHNFLRKEYGRELPIVVIPNQNSNYDPIVVGKMRNDKEVAFNSPMDFPFVEDTCEISESSLIPNQ